MESLPLREHPVATLDWEVARSNFYAAAADGLDAELTWVDADGRETTRTDAILGELLDYARDGLELRGVDDAEIDRHLHLLDRRVETGVTPAAWKRRRVRDLVDDGAGLADAVAGMQVDYVDRQSETLVDGTLVEWL